MLKRIRAGGCLTVMKIMSRWKKSELCRYSHDNSINSFFSSSSTATPMLSLVMTRFSIASEPSELAIASWLNSTVCFCTMLNLTAKKEKSSSMCSFKTTLKQTSKMKSDTTILNLWVLLYSLFNLVEYCTSIYMFPVRFRHGSGPGFWAEKSIISLFTQLHKEVVVILLCLHFLGMIQQIKWFWQTVL